MSWQKTLLVLSITTSCFAGICAFSAGARDKQPVDFGVYLSKIQRRIDAEWSSPRTGQSRTTVVRFKVHKNGSESHLRVVRTSGDEGVDAAALRAVNDAAPFNELPDSSPAAVDVEFTFHHNVLKDGVSQSRTIARLPDVDPQLVVARFSEPAVDFGPYMAELQRRIKEAWFPPKGEESRRVMVVFKLDEHGTLSHLRVEKTSGVASANKAALKAVEQIAPFRPLPEGSPKDVDIQFTFDYNVFGGKSSSPPLEPPPTTTTLKKPSSLTRAVVDLNNDGVRALNANDFDLAIEKFEEALQLKPDYALAKENLAIAYNNNGLMKQNAPKEAIVQFHKALYFQPNNATTHKNLDGIIAYMGKDPASFKVRVGLAEEALGREDQIGAFIEYKQALAIKEDAVVRAKFNEVARALDANYRPVAIAGSTNSGRQPVGESAIAAAENTPSLFSSIPGWAVMLAAMAGVFAVGLIAGSTRQNRTANSKNTQRAAHEETNT